MDRQKEEWMERRMDRRMDRQKDGQMEGQIDRPYFMGPFRSWLGVQ